MYSLGCLIHAVHLKGDPPFKNFGNLGSVREHAGRPLSGIARLDRDLQGTFLPFALSASLKGPCRSNARLTGDPASTEQADTRLSSDTSFLFVFANFDPQLLGSI